MNKKILRILVGIFILITGIVGCDKKEEEQLSIDTKAVETGIIFVDYEADGTAMQLILYKDDDHVIHGAFNTCQVCNGSPYAYFVQEGNDIVCQNCGNHFTVNEIGVGHGGCNPVPLEFTQEGEVVQIEVKHLLENAFMFENWKRGI